MFTVLNFEGKGNKWVSIYIVLINQICKSTISDIVKLIIASGRDCKLAKHNIRLYICLYAFTC